MSRSELTQLQTLVRVISARLREILPSDEVEVTVEEDGRAFRLEAVGLPGGNVVWLSPMTLWDSELAIHDRLTLFLSVMAERVQTFVSARRRGCWPSMTAKPHVAVGNERILVWWGGVTPAEAIVSLRPILCQELGLDDGTGAPD